METLHCSDATIIEVGEVNGSEPAIADLAARVEPAGGGAELFVCVDRGMEVVPEKESGHGVGARVAPAPAATKGDDSSPKGEEDKKDAGGGEEGCGEEEEAAGGGRVVTGEMIGGGKAQEGFARCRVVEAAGAPGGAVAEGAFGKVGVGGGVPLDVKAAAEEGRDGGGDVFVPLAGCGREGGEGGSRAAIGARVKKEVGLGEETVLPGGATAGCAGGRRWGAAVAQSGEVGADIGGGAEGRAGEVYGGVGKGGAGGDGGVGGMEEGGKEEG